ncbi:hypothetical protein ASD62_03425 [Phycicoccus sp. Root563]|nr:hypothetical protein ASD62_03425 [Phycicoccus sp. Root563]
MQEGRHAATELIGRDDDILRFKRLLFDTDVLVFTGASGVGKTSMLQVGLVPGLRESGYTVVLCNQWSRRSSEIAEIVEMTTSQLDPADKADRLLQALLTEKLPVRARLGLTEGGDLLSTLDRSYGDKCVVVLDQFEELMRYRPDAFQWVLRWIEKAAVTDVRVVISLRVEYEHQLGGHAGLRLGPFSQKRFELAPITSPEHVARIIEGPHVRTTASDDVVRGDITLGASRRIVDAWVAAGVDGMPQDRGLLHLQALLFVLWRRVEGRRIEASDLTRYFRHQEGAALFHTALAEAVAVSVDLCSQTCASAGIPDVLTARTKHYVRAISAHLSSGGFKVDHSREDLGRLVVRRDGTQDLPDQFRSTAERARLALATRVDESIVGGSPTRGDDQKDTDNRDWLAVERHGLMGGVESARDEHELTAGVLLGRSPIESHVEEYRAFHFAIEWLRMSQLVRITTPEQGKTMVSLVHDLFGAGLIQWSAAVGDTSGGLTAEEAVHQFSALRGVRMSWQNRVDETFLNGRLLVNQRWKFCEVSADLRDVTFVNCDLQGTVFRRCTFNGVQFVNCILDDVEMLDCTVVGSPSPTPSSTDIPPEDRDRLGSRPSFLVDDADVVQALRWYAEPRQDVSADLRILSEPEVAAVVTDSKGSPSELPFERQPGGLTMFGGRLSSLKIRSCTFVRSGQISLRHVAGTSVEFAEQTHARLSMFDAALRGLTITRPVEHSQRSRPRDFVLDFTESHIINTWFGVGLRGRATFDSCVVWQLFNAADPKDFTVRTPLSRQYGAVNVGALPGDQELPMSALTLGVAEPTDLAPAWDGRASVDEASRKIDYRRYSRERMTDDSGGRDN